MTNDDQASTRYHEPTLVRVLKAAAVQAKAEQRGIYSTLLHTAEEPEYACFVNTDHVLNLS